MRRQPTQESLAEGWCARTGGSAIRNYENTDSHYSFYGVSRIKRIDVCLTLASAIRSGIMKLSQIHLPVRIGIEAAIIFILINSCLVPAVAQESNGSLGSSLLETVDVPSERPDPVYTTNVLEDGKYYTIHAIGPFSFWDGSTEGADAYYDYRDQGVDYRPLQLDNSSMRVSKNVSIVNYIYY